ncbi:hypothetical protein HY734_00350 [Candidatus Uhrbacteria bacterium]|nr:hypothetical protein [Candidatus Uhrbacteria bacterium]
MGRLRNPCPEGAWSLYALTEVPVALCVPDTYSEGQEAGTAEETHIAFTQKDAQVTLLALDAEPHPELDKEELVSFSCLEDAADGEAMKLCFNRLYRVNDVERFVLANGASAYEAHLEIPKLESENYSEAAFVLIPSVASLSWNAEITVPVGDDAQARQMAETFVPWDDTI